MHTHLYNGNLFSVSVLFLVLKTVEISGRNVTLNTDTEVQRDDLVLWMFGDQGDLIAQLTGETGEMTYGMRFRDKLTLNKNTGSLSIRDITSGPYNLHIISSKRTSYRKFRVFKPCESFVFLLVLLIAKEMMSKMYTVCLILAPN